MDLEAQEARIRELVDEIDSDTGSDFSGGSGDEYNPDSESDSQSDIETDSCEEDIGRILLFLPNLIFLEGHSILQQTVCRVLHLILKRFGNYSRIHRL